VSPAPILDVLTRLEELGVPLHSDGQRAWPARPVPPDVAAAVRQCNHQVARLVGRRDV
jgi:hypothetical protein